MGLYDRPHNEHNERVLMRAEDIVDLRIALVADGAERHSKYDFLMDASGGDYETRRLQGLWDQFIQFVGLDQKMPLDRETFEFRLNLIPSVIRASRSFISTIPSLKCPPSDPSDQEARKTAEKLERVILGMWNYSHIGKRMNQLGYWNPSLGNTVGVVWPDIKNKRPTLQMRSPYGFYPVIRDIDGFDLECAIFHTKYTRRQCKAMYSDLPASFEASDDLCNVDQYFDEKEIVTIVDDEHRCNRIENKWKFVPIVIIANETFGEGPWGDSDIEWMVPLQAEHNYRETMKNAIIAFSQMQPLAIEAGEQMDEELHMGILDGINVELGGKVYRVNPPQVPYQIFQAQNDLLSLIDRVGNTPSVMRSEASGNTATGKGISALLGPTQMAYNIKGNEIYPALSVMNKMAMQMWHAMWPDEEHTVFALDQRKGKAVMNVEKFKTGEFAPWFENVVYVDSSSYLDSTQRFIRDLQAVQNRLMSRRTAMSHIDGVDDPTLEEQFIDEEMQKDLQLTQPANQAFADANVQPNMAAQGYANYGLEKGYMGKMPAAEPTGGIEAQEAPEEEMPQSGGLIELFVEFFNAIPLKGKVWLAGNIVTDPAYSPESPNWNGVEVFLESMGDKSAINQKMRDEYQAVWGNLVYHQGPPSADEPSMLVYDPDTEDIPDDFGMEEMPEGGMPPEGTMPPEMAGMMGGM
jgi:hypothetical protein